MEVDDDQSLEEMKFVTSAVSDSAGWHEHLRVKHMWQAAHATFVGTVSTDKESFKFLILHSFWWKMVAGCTRSTFVGVRIAVFSSAIVIDVIVHCHTAGALLSQCAENNCPYHRVVGF